MAKQNSSVSNLMLGVFLILLGIFILLIQIGRFTWCDFWPILIIAAGLLFVI